jgi:hypothetical protein
VPYVDKVKSVKNTGFPNRGEQYGAKYENEVAYLLSYTVSVEKLWTQNTCIIHDVWRLLILSNEEKTNDYENFEKERTPWTQSESNSATYKKNRSSELSGL